MNINNLLHSSFFLDKQEMTSIYQKKIKTPQNKIVVAIKSRMDNEAALLEISEESLQQLKIRNLYKMEKLEMNIIERLDEIEEKQGELLKLDEDLKIISDMADEFIKKLASEQKEGNSNKTVGENDLEIKDGQILENNTINEELLELGKTIEENMKRVADAIEAAEKTKAEREGKEYQKEGSIAERFRNADFGLVRETQKAINEARKFVEEEIAELNRQIEKMEEKMDELLNLKNEKIITQK